MQFKRGDVVKVSGNMDREFSDRHGAFVEYAPIGNDAQGYARLALYGDAKDRRVLVHPESLTLVHRSA